MNYPGWVSAVMLLAATSAHAQTLSARTNGQVAASNDDERDRVHLGILYVRGWPVGEFREFADPVSGLGIEATVRFGHSPFRLGGSAYFHYFSEADDVGSPALGGLTRPVVDQTMTLFHGLIRVQPTRGRFRPYADGLIGVVGFQNRGSIRPVFREAAFSLGAGGGVMVAIAQVGDGHVSADLGVRYVGGGAAEAGDDAVIPALDDSVLRSRTDLVIFKAGVVVGF